MQRIYLIKQNESIEKIAKINSLDPKKIKICQEKILGYPYAILNDDPSDIQLIENYYPPILYKVTEEDTKESLQAEGYELSKEDIEPGDIILLTKIEGKKHIVKPLESLEDISKMYFMDKLDIIQRNNLKTEKLFIGQILWI